MRRSALALLDVKGKRDEEEISFAPVWHSCTNGDAAAPRVNAARYFSLEELKTCTDNFSKNNKIGAGGFGEVYKGYCTDGVVVAIKRARRARRGSLFSRKDFQSEIEVLSRVHHKNIVSFLGFCFEQGEQMLVYENISKGTLFDNLAGKGDVCLDWKRRLQIALDSARGLAYLHELVNPQIIHGHVKSANIMLDENLNAKISSFIFSKLVPENQKTQVSSQVKRTPEREESAVQFVAGTPGYVDPESVETGLLSEKSDIYSFGVVMLELITARRPIESGISLADVVYRAIDENDQEYFGLRDIIDPKIVDQVRAVGLRKFVQLALKCLEDSGSDRPSMSEIMKEIDIVLQHDGNEKRANVDSSADFGNAADKIQ